MHGYSLVIVSAAGKDFSVNVSACLRGTLEKYNKRIYDLLQTLGHSLRGFEVLHLSVTLSRQLTEW